MSSQYILCWILFSPMFIWANYWTLDVFSDTDASGKYFSCCHVLLFMPYWFIFRSLVLFLLVAFRSCSYVNSTQEICSKWWKNSSLSCIIKINQIRRVKCQIDCLGIFGRRRGYTHYAFVWSSLFLKYTLFLIFNRTFFNNINYT